MRIEAVADSTVAAAGSAVAEVVVDTWQQVVADCMRGCTVLDMALDRQDALRRQRPHFGAFAGAADNADHTRSTCKGEVIPHDQKAVFQMVDRHCLAIADGVSELVQSCRRADSRIR